MACSGLMAEMKQSLCVQHSSPAELVGKISGSAGTLLRQVSVGVSLEGFAGFLGAICSQSIK